MAGGLSSNVDVDCVYGCVETTTTVDHGIVHFLFFVIGGGGGGLACATQPRPNEVRELSYWFVLRQRP